MIGIAHHNPETVNLFIDKLVYKVHSVKRDDHDFTKLINILSGDDLRTLVLFVDLVETTSRLFNKVQHPALKDAICCVFDTPEFLLKYQSVSIIDADYQDDKWVRTPLTTAAMNTAFLQAETGCDIKNMDLKKCAFSECVRQVLSHVLDDSSFYLASTLATAKYRRTLTQHEKNEWERISKHSGLSSSDIESLEKKQKQLDPTYFERMSQVFSTDFDEKSVNIVSSTFNVPVKDIQWVLTWKIYEQAISVR